MKIIDESKLLTPEAATTVSRWASRNVPNGTYETWINSDINLALIAPGEYKTNPFVRGYVIPTNSLGLVEDWFEEGIMFRRINTPEKKTSFVEALDSTRGIA
ncbi:MAG: hypothetical protein AAB663_02185 [Patescibacteria group bacterium]